MIVTQERYKQYGEIKAVDIEQRTIRFVISSDELDRDNEVVTVEAVADAIAGFAQNPVCLLNHQHRSESGQPTVIGSWQTETYKALKHHSEMDLKFATTELGETCWQLCRDKHMRATSIGFRILEAHPEDYKGGRILVITKIELFEISVVAVGANRRALAKGLLTRCGFEDVLDGGGEDRKLAVEDLPERIAKMVEERIKEQLDDAVVRMTDLVDEIKDATLGDRGAYAEEVLLGGSADLRDDSAKGLDAERLEAVIVTAVKKGLGHQET